MMELDSFARLLQMSLMPGVLISGAGLLLLSITNRLARTIDRSRGLAEKVEPPQTQERATRSQLEILMRRAGLLRWSAWFVALSILFSSLMIVGTFLMIFFKWAICNAVLTIFFGAVVSLILSLLFFIWDVSLSLHALRLELGLDNRSQS